MYKTGLKNNHYITLKINLLPTADVKGKQSGKRTKNISKSDTTGT
jgi:hypothetical protein